MKELEKTKRISIAAVISILVVLMGLLTFKKPKNLYMETAKSTLQHITEDKDVISLEEVQNNPQAVLVDIRDQYEYEKGHLPEAIHINVSNILSDEATEKFNAFKEENKTVALYGGTPNEVIPAFMLLHQLGIEDLKIVSINNDFDHNQLMTTKAEVEKAVADPQAFIDASIKAANEVKAVPAAEVKPVPRKVVPVAKKKAKVEGGC